MRQPEPRTAVVTGAARGGGRGIAEALADRVDDLVLVSRSTAGTPNPRLPGTLEEVEASLAGARAAVHTVRADLSRAADVERVVEVVHGRFGGCDLLVNNAAFNPTGRFLDRSAASWDAAFAVNVTAPAALCRAFVPGMIARGHGRVVNVGSLAALEDFDHQIAYAASKAALERFSRAFGAEIAGTGVRVTCVRVDEALRSEALAALMGEFDDGTGGCTPREFGDAVATLLFTEAETAPVLGFADLRRLGALPEVTA